ncbi:MULTISPECIES: acetylornithine transaminase [unclassified Bacillus (in: firmicutes)]|uniref:acetylornithine transaminase n=1 Tax=unclassified Bacillus (in: firmicutes) TaxID=185979 RepID=UPI00080ACFFA|nr:MULTISPECIES: acetylornithine transaminase [unclassified Bacillus (in: firmicutes)]OCA89984.1 acetylornithine aminotransferase [Bacillus sp. FJAT-27986]
MSALLPVYKKWDITPIKADGSWIEAEGGKKYLDFTSGIGVVNLGHKNDEVKKSVEAQMELFWHTSNLFQLPIQEEVALKLNELTGLDGVFFCNSGAEANEAALKLARRATGKTKIITFQQSFHGRTFGAMAATGQSSIHDGFGPLLEGFVYVPFNDIDAVHKAIDEDVAAIMVEIIQGEGGIILIDEGFLKSINQLCNENNILLIIDEVQTGNGRTGYPYAYLKYKGIKPDIVTTAKGLANGLPIGAMVAKKELKESFGKGVHGSTFGGNPVSLAASKVVLNQISNPQFLAEIRDKAEWFISELKIAAEDIPVIKEIRGEGLMIGIELKEEVAPYIKQIIEHQLFVLQAGSHVIRLLPPLTVSRDELLLALAILKEVCKTNLTMTKA